MSDLVAGDRVRTKHNARIKGSDAIRPAWSVATVIDPSPEPVILVKFDSGDVVPVHVKNLEKLEGNGNLVQLTPHLALRILERAVKRNDGVQVNMELCDQAVSRLWDLVLKGE